MATISVRSLADHIEAARRRNVFALHTMVRQHTHCIVKALDEWEARGLARRDAVVLMGLKGMYLGARAKAVSLTAAVAGLPAKLGDRLTSNPLPSVEHVRVFAALPDGFCGLVLVEPELLEAARAELQQKSLRQLTEHA